MSADTANRAASRGGAATLPNRGRRPSCRKGADEALGLAVGLRAVEAGTGGAATPGVWPQPPAPRSGARRRRPGPPPPPPPPTLPTARAPPARPPAACLAG